jgi:hypothetical protein
MGEEVGTMQFLSLKGSKIKEKRKKKKMRKRKKERKI